MKKGVTTNNEWNSRIKNNPAPWAEVEVPGKYILTVPSLNLSQITDIVALGVLYDDIMNSAMKLAGLEVRFRTERVVFDVQISGGMSSSKLFMNFLRCEFCNNLYQLHYNIKYF